DLYDKRSHHHVRSSNDEANAVTNFPTDTTTSAIINIEVLASENKDNKKEKESSSTESSKSDSAEVAALSPTSIFLFNKATLFDGFGYFEFDAQTLGFDFDRPLSLPGIMLSMKSLGLAEVKLAEVKLYF
ncbi:LOW QUALITY PROTEIN: hypothetical protein PanWU01x14_269130, partial [Parasponia andersonii]